MRTKRVRGGHRRSSRGAWSPREPRDTDDPYGLRAFPWVQRIAPPSRSPRRRSSARICGVMTIDLLARSFAPVVCRSEVHARGQTMRSRAALIAVVVLATPRFVGAFPGALDPFFGSGGRTTTEFEG